LFYAAFELRCGIERRVHDYVDALKHISERKKRGWKIIGKAKELEKAFQSGDKIIELAILDEKSGELWFNLYYTPGEIPSMILIRGGRRRVNS
jgi:hypothetical protein